MAALDDELLAHHISTIKHGSALGASVTPYLREMKAIIRKEVAAFDSEARTAARLEKLLADLVNVLSKHATGWEKQLIEDLKAFAEYEVNYQADTISDWINVDLVNPTPEQAWAAAEFEPLSLGTGPVDFNKLIDDWGEDEVSRLVMGVKTGFVQGHSVRRIIKDVTGAGGLADISQRNAEAVAHTALMHVASEARMEVYKENADIVIGYEIVATLDSRTCLTPDTLVYTPSGRAKIGDLVAGDVVIGGSGNARKVTGVDAGTTEHLLSVEIENGNIVMCTKDHQWLTTNRGWVEAGELTHDDHIATLPHMPEGN